MTFARGKPLLSMLHATFRLGERLVFPDTSWIIRRGEQWAVLGPNGSGKSLLGDCLRGRMPLVQGGLEYHFRPPPHLSPEETIGHVSFEERKLHLPAAIAQSRWNSLEQDGASTLSEFLSYDRVMEVNPFEVTDQHTHARPAFGRRLRRAISLLDLGSLLNRTFLSLSNGETQRAELARSLCQPLRLLILDEPFNGLDAGHRRHFHQLLERLMEAGLPVVLITTQAEDLPRHTTHVIFVERCRIAAAGSRRTLFGSSKRQPPQVSARVARPETAFTQEGHLRRRGVAAETQNLPTRNQHPAPGTVVVKLRGVTVRYASVTILRDINWTIRAGESWALLGPNGSGKSTLLSLIQGDNPQAYSNDILVFGRNRGSGESIWDIKRHIGCVSPELHLEFERNLTCFEIVASGFEDTVGPVAAIARKERAAVRHWLREFGLAEHSHSLFPALSTGLQRMVLLARALVKSPALLLLDEPCQGLDDAHRQLFVSTLDTQLSAGAATAVFGTHRVEEIPPSIKRVLRLERGRAIEQD
jgi:molybdate transport system ATP-binding protein